VGPNVPLLPTLTVPKKGEGNKKNPVPYTGIIQDYCAPSVPAAAWLTASQIHTTLVPELAQVWGAWLIMGETVYQCHVGRGDFISTLRTKINLNYI